MHSKKCIMKTTMPLNNGVVVCYTILYFLLSVTKTK